MYIATDRHRRIGNGNGNGNGNGKMRNDDHGCLLKAHSYSKRSDDNNLMRNSNRRRERGACRTRRTRTCNKNRTTLVASAHVLHVGLMLIITHLLSMPRVVHAKICVEIEKDSFLCTDDVAKARAAVKGGQPVRFASGKKRDFGKEQRNDGSEEQQRNVNERMEKVEEYFETVVLADSKYDDVIDECKNKHELCTYWAAIHGECEKNPTYMQKDCAPACMSCDQLLDS